MFGSADIWSKLEKDPRTKEFCHDPSFRTVIKNLQDNPGAIMTHLSDPRYAYGAGPVEPGSLESRALFGLTGRVSLR